MNDKAFNEEAKDEIQICIYKRKEIAFDDLKISQDEIQVLKDIDLLTISKLQLVDKMGDVFRFSFTIENNGVQELDLGTYISVLPESIKKSLESLNLKYNNGIPLPKPHYQFPELVNPKLSEIWLQTLLKAIFNLQSLTYLNLESNEIRRLPESIGNLKSLRELNLDYNYLTSLPKTIGDLTSLEKLSLEFNLFQYLPQEIGRLKNLKCLMLNNKWKVTLLPEYPDTKGKWNSRESAILGRSRLSELPSSITKLSSLKYLNLSNRKINKIPEGFSELRSLTDLDLSFNDLNTIPDSFSDMEHLEVLNLEGNPLVSLPESIGNLSTLKELNLENTKLDSRSSDLIKLLRKKGLSVYGPIVSFWG